MKSQVFVIETQWLNSIFSHNSWLCFDIYLSLYLKEHSHPSRSKWWIMRSNISGDYLQWFSASANIWLLDSLLLRDKQQDISTYNNWTFEFWETQAYYTWRKTAHQMDSLLTSLQSIWSNIKIFSSGFDRLPQKCTHEISIEWSFYVRIYT